MVEDKYLLEELTWEEAADGAHNLLNLARIVYC